jgi:ferric iron reductase protein FhuF
MLRWLPLEEVLAYWTRCSEIPCLLALILNPAAMEASSDPIEVFLAEQGRIELFYSFWDRR